MASLAAPERTAAPVEYLTMVGMANLTHGTASLGTLYRVNSTVMPPATVPRRLLKNPCFGQYADERTTTYRRVTPEPTRCSMPTATISRQRGLFQRSPSSSLVNSVESVRLPTGLEVVFPCEGLSVQSQRGQRPPRELNQIRPAHLLRREQRPHSRPCGHSQVGLPTVADSQVVIVEEPRIRRLGANNLLA